MRSRRRAHTLWVVLAAAVACGDGPGEGGETGAAVRDSAGVRIVTHAGPAPSLWGAREVVRVGAADGPESETFHRIADIEVVGDRVYVLDSGDYRVKAYDPSGAYLLGFGREGEGPADFRGPTQLMARGDTVTVFDYRLGKLASFDADGELLASFRPQFQEQGVFSPAGMEPIDGGFVAWTFPGFCRMPPPEERDLTWRLFRVDRDGGRPDTLIVAPGRSMVAIYLLDLGQCTVVQRVAGRFPQVAVSPDGRIAYGDGDTYEVLILPPVAETNGRGEPGIAPGSAAGPPGFRLHRTPGAILRRSVELRPVTESEREENRQSVLDPEGPRRLSPEMRRAAAHALDSVPAFDTWPAFDRLVWDSTGRLWVRRRDPVTDETATWDVYDAGGALVAETRLPALLQVYRIQANTVWGVEFGAFGVQQLVGYEVVGEGP